MEQINLTPVMLVKAKTAKSAEDLIALAQEYGIALTGEDAQQAFERLSASGELSEDELEAVAGGPSSLRGRPKMGSC